MELYIHRFYAICTTLIVLIQLPEWRICSLADNKHPTCTTAECQYLGKVYMQLMNHKGEPCTDFYDYVCSNWITYNPKPKEVPYTHVWDIEQTLEFRTLKQLKKLLENGNNSSTMAFRRAQLLYKTCIEKPFLPRLNYTVIRSLMAPNLFSFSNTASVSEPSFSEIDNRYITLTGESALFGFDIQFHPTMPNTLITEIKPLSSAYGALLSSSKWPTEDQLNHYKVFLYEIIASIVGPNSLKFKEKIEGVVNEVLVFRENLYECIKWEGFYTTKIELMTIRQLRNWYNLETDINPNIKINWIEMIRALYKNSSEITESSWIKIHIHYLTQLIDLLKETPTRVIANHIHLYFAERHLERTSQMAANLKESVIEMGVDANGEITREPPRWKTCIEDNAMKIALGKAYTESFFSQKQKTEVTQLFETAKKILEKLISQSKWLDFNTKQSSIAKVRNIRGEIGYPDWYDTNRPPPTDSDDVNPLKSQAHYVNELNRVFASATYFQPPIYGPNLPYVIHYGSTLSVLGHELHHAFDYDGITYDAEGKTTSWPPSMIIEHEKRTECFEQQFNKLKQNEYQKLKLHTHNNRTFEYTADEDMADAMGLKLSYMGFKEMVKKNDGVCPVLPGFESFGCEQLFFIAFANVFCATIPQEQQELFFFDDTHSLPRIRVNGAVANMKEFKTAFGCKSEHPPNVDQPCDFWK